MTTDNLYAHLTQLQNIAKANKGTRAVGTPGFEASIDYVVGVLRSRASTFRYRRFWPGCSRMARWRSPSPGGGHGEGVEYSIATRGVSGPLVAAPSTTAPAVRCPTTTARR